MLILWKVNFLSNRKCYMSYFERRSKDQSRSMHTGIWAHQNILTDMCLAWRNGEGGNDSCLKGHRAGSHVLNLIQNRNCRFNSSLTFLLQKQHGRIMARSCLLSPVGCLLLPFQSSLLSSQCMSLLMQSLFSWQLSSSVNLFLPKICPNATLLTCQCANWLIDWISDGFQKQSLSKPAPPIIVGLSQ